MAGTSFKQAGHRTGTRAGNPGKAAFLFEPAWVESARGRCKVKAYVTERVNEKTIFMPFHWAGIFEGESYADRYPSNTGEVAYGDSVNIIASAGYDEQTQMQETKVALCKVYKA